MLEKAETINNNSITKNKIELFRKSNLCIVSPVTYEQLYRVVWLRTLNCLLLHSVKKMHFFVALRLSQVKKNDEIVPR